MAPPCKRFCASRALRDRSEDAEEPSPNKRCVSSRLMRVLVLGGTRFVGPHVVRNLVQHGHEVLVFHRGTGAVDPPDGVASVIGDLAQLNEHLDALAKWRPDVVVDMIPFRQEHGRRVREFKGVAERGVVISSIDVYRAFGRLHGSEPGPPDATPLTELSPLRSILVEPTGMDPLDYNKTGVELEARGDPDFPVTALRLPGVHGPGDYYHRLYAYLRQMDDARPAILLDERLADWRWVRGYVEDVGYAIALAATDARAANRVYNVAEPICYSEREWIERIAHVHGWDGDIVAVPSHLLPDSMRVAIDTHQDYRVDTSRIRSELDYSEPTPSDEAIRRTFEWERSHEPEKPDLMVTDYAVQDSVLAQL
jgi:nucleoside-diphosphate-sugar epimerase